MIRTLKKAIVQDIEQKLTRAFTRISSDIEHLNKWVKHLYDSQNKLHKHHSEHVNLTRKDVANLNQWINYLHKHRSELNTELRQLTRYLYETASANKELSRRVEKIEQESKELRTALRQMKNQQEKASEVQSSVRTEPRTRFVSEPEYSGTKTRFEQKVVRKVMQNKRNLVLNEMLRAISSQHPSTKELEKTIVEEKELCGRTTFYSYLKQLRDTGQVTDKRNAAGNTLTIGKKSNN